MISLGAGKGKTRVVSSIAVIFAKVIKKIDRIYIAFPSSLLLESDQEVYKKLNSALEDQFTRMELDWDASMKEITDDTTLEELQKVVKESETAVDKTLDDSRKFIDDKSVPNPGTGTSSTGHAKIDDTLRPKDTLLRSFNMEEENLWLFRLRCQNRF